MPIASARNAREVLLRVARCNAECQRRTGAIDVCKIAAILEKALRDPTLSPGVLLGLAEFIGTAVDGSVIDLRSWKPLERYSPHYREPPTVPLR
jgi:hypothetical protein